MVENFSLPYDESVDVRTFGSILSNNLTNSYKIYWFKGIYDCILKGKQEMTFNELTIKMISNAWFSVTKYKLNLGMQDKLGELIESLYNEYPHLDSEKSLEKLEKSISKIKDTKVKRQIKNLETYVPYRLLSPFVEEDMKKEKVKDNKKNNYIKEMSLKNNMMYEIYEKSIKIKDNYFKYIYNNQLIIKSWIDYNLICYLQKRNPNVPNIPFKIDLPAERNLKDATKLWKAVLEKVDIKDIYTDDEFIEENFDERGSLSIDHYIPWSFVLHDETWNLVPTFKNVNSSKSNNLPNLEKTLDKFCDMQYILFCYLKTERKKKALEDYMNVSNAMRKVCMKEKVTKEEFTEALKHTIYPLYQIAYNQGYGLWAA